MGTPRRRSILANIETTLQGLTVANGYKTTIETVEPKIRSREGVKDGELPYAGFGPSTGNTMHYPFGQMRCVMPINILGIVSGSGDDEISDNVNNLEDDIIAIMMLDPTRGGFAVDTYNKEEETDEVDPDATKRAEVYVRFDVIYDRSTAKS